MPSCDTIRNYHKQQAEDQSRTEARRHVATIRNAVEIAEMEIPPIDWLVQTLIAPGMTTIAGQSGAGKSWLLLQLGLALSAGGFFLGSLRCRKADVLYLALEDSNWRIKSRLLRLGMNITRGLYVDTANEVTPKNINLILDEMPTVKMVIIDTLGRYLQGENVDGNDYMEMTNVVGQMHDIAKKRDIAIIACTHTRKGAKIEDGIDGVIGSKAIVGVSDTILMLTRKHESTEGKLYVTGRDIQERTIEIEHTDNWLWHDINADASTPDRLSEFDYVPDTNCTKCGGTGVYSYDDHEGHHTVHCDCGYF